MVFLKLSLWMVILSEVGFGNSFTSRSESSSLAVMSSIYTETVGIIAQSLSDNENTL